MLIPVALVLKQPTAMYCLPGMILQYSPFLVIVEICRLTLSISVRAMTYQLTTPQKAEVFFWQENMSQIFGKKSVVYNFRQVINLKKVFFYCMGESLLLSFTEPFCCLFILRELMFLKTVSLPLTFLKNCDQKNVLCSCGRYLGMSNACSYL